jgi:hypothetical protein
VRVWYQVPFVDRYAHVWMWAHGGWDTDAPPGPAGPETAGVREPLGPRPKPVLRAAEKTFPV